MPEVSGALGRVRSAPMVIHGDYVTLRFERCRVAGIDQIVSLELEATHPKVPNARRVFPLSHILADGYRRCRTTVEQIVARDLSMESRLDALRTVMESMTVKDIPVRAEPSPRQRASADSPDELEPTFAIRNTLHTELRDVLRGYSRRAVTVYRNEKPLLDFFLIEDRAGLRHASMHVHPGGLEWPLLDAAGEAVTTETVDYAIHDFTHILRRARSASPRRALEAVALEITERVRRNPDASKRLQERFFVEEIAAAARDVRLWSLDFGVPEISPVLAPEGQGFLPRTLPDNRMIWVQHETEGRIPNVVRVVGFSTSGTKFQVEFHYPANLEWKIGATVGTFMNGEGRPSFERLIGFLFSARKSGLSIHFSNAAESYPAAVNALIQSVSETHREELLDRGLVPAHSRHQEIFIPVIVDELVRGRLPLGGVFGRGGPAYRWCVQAFLDEDLDGKVVAVNGFGGVITLTSLPGSSLVARRAQLLRLFDLLHNAPRDILELSLAGSAFREDRKLLPEWGECETYQRVNRAAKQIWRVAVATGGFGPNGTIEERPWLVSRDSGSRWSVSLPSVYSTGERLPYVIKCSVGNMGVEEIVISEGRRDLFGRLRGVSLKPLEYRPFTEPEVRAILSASCAPLLWVDKLKAMQAACPDMVGFSWVGLRSIDPEVNRRDIIAKVWNWLRTLW